MIEEKIDNFFEEYCNRYNRNFGMTKKKAYELVDKADFNLHELLELSMMCSRRRGGDRTIQICATKRAVEKAATLSDWVAIADWAPGTGPLRKRAYAEILKFDISSGEDIQLLVRSGSVRLEHVGWYLSNRKKYISSQIQTEK